MVARALLLSGTVLLAASATAGGHWRCCWGIPSCESWSEASCPPVVAGCSTQATCTAAGCDHGSNGTQPRVEGLWCRTALCDRNGRNCASSTFDDNLRLPVRPPRQTADQAHAMWEIQSRALQQSAAARGWVLDYFNSPKFRHYLDPSLEHFSNGELLEMFTWEFQRLPLIHNTPVDDWDVDRIGIGDDTPLNVTLDNGNLQQPCQRYVLGGPESLFPTIMYASMYVSDFFLGAAKLCDLTSTLRQSNNCMMYNANNLRKTSIGNTDQFGAITYVLDEKALAGRSFWEPVDGGMYDLFQYIPPFLFRPYPAQGTIYPPAFYHLLKPHEDVFNMGGGYKTIATVFNSWWVPGAPMATGAVAGTSMMDGNPYFEVMVNGNALIPEDLTSVIAKFASSLEVSDGSSGPGSPGLWGTTLGTKLRAWMIAKRRPLIWSDGIATPMLFDPHVAASIPGFSQREQITNADLTLFETLWKQGRPFPSSVSQAANETAFGRLAARASPHLHFQWRNWMKKSACEQEEVAGNVIMGTDGNGKCVFRSEASAGYLRWECLNDGTCAQSTDESRAVFGSATECLASCATSFECVRVDGARQPQRGDFGRGSATVPLPSAPRSPAPAYCLPRSPLGPNSSHPVQLAGATTLDRTVYNSVTSCEAACLVDDPGRDFVCMDWVLVIQSVLVVYFVSHALGYCAVIKWVVTRQKFRRQLTRCLCCSKVMLPRVCCFCVPRPSCTCCWMTFCPCLQYFRVLGFLHGKCCGWCGCVCFSLCCLSNPFGIVFSLVLNGVCGCWISAYTRYRIRNRLGIAGTIWDDILIHLCATSCARCQESLELSSAGFSGCMYENTTSVNDNAMVSPALQNDIDEHEEELLVTPMQPTSPSTVTPTESLTTSLLHGERALASHADPHSVAQSAAVVGTVSSTWTVDDHDRAAAAARESNFGPQANTIN